MRKTLFYILALALFTFSFTKKGDGVKFSSDKWGEVTKEARSKDKPIFVMVTAPWCNNSAKMLASIFPDPELGSFMNENFVSAKLNSEENINNMRVSSWGVKTVPTMIFLNKNKKVVHMVSGYKTKQQMMEEAKKALEKMNK